MTRGRRKSMDGYTDGYHHLGIPSQVVARYAGPTRYSEAGVESSHRGLDSPSAGHVVLLGRHLVAS